MGQLASVAPVLAPTRIAPVFNNVAITPKKQGQLMMGLLGMVAEIAQEAGYELMEAYQAPLADEMRFDLRDGPVGLTIALTRIEALQLTWLELGRLIASRIALEEFRLEEEGDC